MRVRTAFAAATSSAPERNAPMHGDVVTISTTWSRAASRPTHEGSPGNHVGAAEADDHAPAQPSVNLGAKRGAT